jgi:hypothetical protein
MAIHAKKNDYSQGCAAACARAVNRRAASSGTRDPPLDISAAAHASAVGAIDSLAASTVHILWRSNNPGTRLQ